MSIPVSGNSIQSPGHENSQAPANPPSATPQGVGAVKDTMSSGLAAASGVATPDSILVIEDTLSITKLKTTVAEQERDLEQKTTVFFETRDPYFTTLDKHKIRLGLSDEETLTEKKCDDLAKKETVPLFEKYKLAKHKYQEAKLALLENKQKLARNEQTLFLKTAKKAYKKKSFPDPVKEKKEELHQQFLQARKAYETEKGQQSEPKDANSLASSAPAQSAAEASGKSSSTNPTPKHAPLQKAAEKKPKGFFAAISSFRHSLRNTVKSGLKHLANAWSAFTNWITSFFTKKG